MVLRAAILFVIVLGIFYVMYLPFNKANKKVKTDCNKMNIKN